MWLGNILKTSMVTEGRNTSKSPSLQIRMKKICSKWKLLWKEKDFPSQKWPKSIWENSLKRAIILMIFSWMGQVIRTGSLIFVTSTISTQLSKSERTQWLIPAEAAPGEEVEKWNFIVDGAIKIGPR